MDRSHCKLLYEEGEDLHEYQDFYDFSASYTDAEKRGLVKEVPSAAGAEASTTKIETEKSHDFDDDDEEYVEVSRTLGVNDLGELVLLDGKTVGNRQWSRYYRQRLRGPDEREVVVAQRRAMRLRLGALYDEEVRVCCRAWWRYSRFAVERHLKKVVVVSIRVFLFPDTFYQLIAILDPPDEYGYLE